MKIDGFLSLKDYFNYYIAGLIWCMNLFCLWIIIFGRLDFNSILPALSNAAVVVIVGVLIVIMPYVVGFIMSPLGEYVRICWQGGRRSEDRKLYPDPKQHILMFDNEYFKEQRIPQKVANKIIGKVQTIFHLGIKNEKFYQCFYIIRAYVLEHGGNSAVLIERARDLVNFTESLLLPVPLAILFLGFYRLSVFFQHYCVSGVRGYWFYLHDLWIDPTLFFICVGLAGWMHIRLVDRYFQLERYWVEHVYRAFLVITCGEAK